MADGRVEIELDLDTSKAEAEAARSGKKVGQSFADGANGSSKSVSDGLASSVDGASSKAASKADAGGKSAGGKFAGAFKGALMAGVGAAATAAVDIARQSFEAFAEYEQLSGGAAKIFNELDQSQILADANNAYLTLNMSANEYLSTINQVGAGFAANMGDAKGYEVAQKGMQAIADYASGTGRDLNELNEKYGMITRSSASYQSIADQFSGVLPATSSAFLEQAQAAGFLSDEYESLTEVPVAEYQEAVTLMMEQGVADLGLAGNTAAETAGTISGSMAGMAAAWQNWLVALGDPNADIGEMTTRLVDSIIAAASNIIPKFGEIAVSLVQQLPNIIVKFVGALLTHLPDIIVGALQLFGGLVTGLIRAVPTLLTKVGEMGTSIVNKFKALPDLLIQAGRDMIKGLWEGIGSMGEWVINKIKEFAGDIVDGFLDFMDINSPSRLMADLVGKNMALGIAVGFEENDPFDQMQRTLSRGVASMSIAAALAGGTTTDNSQTIHFNQPVRSPDEVARAMRIQSRYGLAGAR